MDPLALINQYGWPIGGLLFVVWALYFEFVVPGARYRRLETEKDEWKQLALELGGMTRSALNVAERHAPPVGTP